MDVARYEVPAAEQLRNAAELVRQLIRANERSLQLAKELMLAHEIADISASRMDTAIDAAAASEGDARAIEEAVAAVAATEKAGIAELTLSKSWGIHLGEVFRLVEVAEAELEQLESGLRRQRLI
jgi:hypothetical protein